MSNTRALTLVVCLAIFCVLVLPPTNAFLLQVGGVSGRHCNLLPLEATATRGMGMGSGSSGTKTKKKNKKSGKSKGMGKKNGKSSKSASTPFDASASLLRLEKKYEEIQKASTRALHSSDDDSSDNNLASEMVVAVRASNSKTAGTSDWVPISQLILHPHTEVSSEWAQAAISLYCRELSFAATIGSKVFGVVPRNELQYAIEPVESFQKYVYDPLVEEQKTNNGGEESISKSEARRILELENINGDNDAAVDERSRIKQSYRRKSFEWHPDRLDTNLSSDEKDHAAREYARIQKAYEILSSEIRTAGSSWYASLGGRERTDFRIVDLMGRDAASSILERYRVQCAVAGLDTELVQLFVARNQAAA